MRQALTALAFVLPFTLATAAFAKDAVEVSVDAKVPLHEAPALKLKVNQDLKSATLSVSAKGASGIRLTKGPAKAGETLEFPLGKHKKPGRLMWSGTLAVKFKDGSAGSMPLSFATEAMNAITLKLDDDKLDLEKHELVMTMSRPAGKVDITVEGENGLIANQSVAFSGEAPGTPLTVGWDPRTKDIALKITLVAHDTDGFFSPSLELSPWSLDIPHEEVNFDTGKSDVRPSEEPKLKATLPEVETAIKRYGKVVKVKLFILGHTDTVGNPSTNQALSHARAQAIARWFKKAGIKVPIYARGFGESMLKVDTPDETDEEQNRRADYTLAQESPTGSYAGWVKIE